MGQNQTKKWSKLFPDVFDHCRPVRKDIVTHEKGALLTPRKPTQKVVGHVKRPRIVIGILRPPAIRITDFLRLQEVVRFVFEAGSAGAGSLFVGVSSGRRELGQLRGEGKRRRGRRGAGRGSSGEARSGRSAGHRGFGSSRKR